MPLTVRRVLGILPITQVRGQAKHCLPQGNVQRPLSLTGIHQQQQQSRLGLEPRSGASKLCNGGGPVLIKQEE